jgi:hypothetical protein
MEEQLHFPAVSNADHHTGLNYSFVTQRKPELQVWGTVSVGTDEPLSNGFGVSRL